MPEESHYFDWTVGIEDRPYTTDPRYAGVLENAPCNRVTLDGVAAGPYVRRCQTGADGWVELLDRGEDGKFRLNEDGTLASVIRRGRVEFSIVAPPKMTAEEAMTEIWGTICPDCGPQDYEFMVRQITFWRRNPDGFLGLRKVQTGYVESVASLVGGSGVQVTDAIPCPRHPAERGLVSVTAADGSRDVIHVDRVVADVFSALLWRKKGG